MKKFMIIITLLVAVLGTNHIVHHYDKMCTVTNISNTQITAKDKQGNFWEWENTDNRNFSIGDKVILKMFDNGTECDITDDKIVKVVK